MGGENHRSASCRQRLEKGTQLLTTLIVEGGERFIEQQHLGLTRQGPGDQSPMPLPAGKGGDRGLGKPRQTHLLQGLGGVLPAAATAQGHQGGQVNRIVPANTGALGHQSQAAALARQGTPAKTNPASAGLPFALKQLQQGGFTGPVAAPDQGAGPPVHGQIEVVQHGGLAVAKGELAGLEQGKFRGHSQGK